MDTMSSTSPPSLVNLIFKGEIGLTNCRNGVGRCVVKEGHPCPTYFPDAQNASIGNKVWHSWIRKRS